MNKGLVVSTVFIPVPGGELALTVYGPEGGSLCRGWVLHLPAFAEEMNKSRPMVSRQARLLSELGYCVVIPDLYGTGDSSGEFGDASWGRWKQDVEAILQWVQQSGGGAVCLWGLRLGCLLALEAARSFPEQVRQLVLWQPVQSGKQAITQFLRLRMAAGLMDGKDESTADLRQLLSAGHSVEVAGYDIAPELALQLDQVIMLELVPPSTIEVRWIEVAGQEDRPLAPVSRKVIEAWQNSGVSVGSAVVQGDPFWTTQEVVLAPRLLESTTDYLRAAFKDAVAPVDCLILPCSRKSSGGLLPVVFECSGEELVGVLHCGAPHASKAVLLVVGGPQYRVGSHRQFVYLARALADAGTPVLRFDYRGMGDSTGELSGFDDIGHDISCALDALQHSLPEVDQVVIWGLCDAASAASFYAASDARIGGLVLLNPWVRSEEGEARAYLKHYYHKRLFSRDFWGKFFRGNFDLFGSLKSLATNVRSAVSHDTEGSEGQSSELQAGGGLSVPQSTGRALADRVYEGLVNSHCPVLIITSGNDLTAAEFMDAVAARKKFRKLIKSDRFELRSISAADHTFSQRVWRDQVSNWTLSWINQL